jgi:hypothetical protein
MAFIWYIIYQVILLYKEYINEEALPISQEGFWLKSATIPSPYGRRNFVLFVHSASFFHIIFMEWTKNIWTNEVRM